MNLLQPASLESLLRNIHVFMGSRALRHKTIQWSTPLLVIGMGFLLHIGFVPSPVVAERVLGGSSEAAEYGSPALAVAQAEAVLVSFDELEFHDEVRGGTSVVAQASARALFASYGADPHTDLGRTVLPGETFASIAVAERVSEKMLRALNPRLSDPLIVGDALVLPAVRATDDGPALTHSGSYLPEGFIWPASGPISQPHGRYAARDIPNKLGTPVRASGDGIVRAVEYGWNGGYGNRIIIDHPTQDIQTLYAHLQDFVVGAGETVLKGQIIGYMGSTGRSTGPHVHFEVR